MSLASPKSLGKFAWYTVETIARTLSIEMVGCKEDFYHKGSRQVIIALWHGRLFVPMFCRRKSGFYVLVSEHRDGDIIASSLDTAGYKTVRGSTTRGGARALVKLIELARQGAGIAFTPDGPKGPRWKFQPGAVYLAAKTGLPIVPITGSVRHAYYFKSWDSFQLPLPFSHAVVNTGEPYEVTGGLDPENIEFHRAELERRMIALSCEADRIVGAPVGK
ncbi:MAG: lysophospholipid acyltransferase family protein [Candidatus Latescibacterota bacterium]